MAREQREIIMEARGQDDVQNGRSTLGRFLVFDLQVLSHLLQLYKNRYLLYTLTLRGVRARYKQTLIGAGWALLTPLAMTAVVVYILSRSALINALEFPAPKVVYILLTTSLWNFFSRAVTNGSSALVQNMDLVTKVYFPREVLPLSSMLTNIIDLGITFLLWTLVVCVYSVFHPDLVTIFPGAPFYPHWGWLWLPPLLVVLLLFISGIVFITSALQVYFRDVGHLVSLGLFLWMMLTPVFYPLGALAGGRTTSLININPMTGLLDSFVTALLRRGNPLEHTHILGGIAMSFLLFIVGYAFFKHEERHFADVV